MSFQLTKGFMGVIYFLRDKEIRLARLGFFFNAMFFDYVGDHGSPDSF